MKYKIEINKDLTDIAKKCDRRIVKARHVISDLNDIIQYSENKMEIESIKFDSCNLESSLIVKFTLKDMDLSDILKLIEEKRNRLIIENIVPINGVYSVFFDYNDDWI